MSEGRPLAYANAQSGSSHSLRGTLGSPLLPGRTRGSLVFRSYDDKLRTRPALSLVVVIAVAIALVTSPFRG